MHVVLLTALGVGGATVIGAIIGFLFKGISHKFSDIVLSFAAGVMLAAAVLGLIVPSLEYGGKYGLIKTIVGIFAGAVCLNLIDIQLIQATALLTVAADITLHTHAFAKLTVFAVFILQGLHKVIQRLRLILNLFIKIIVI